MTPTVRDTEPRRDSLKLFSFLREQFEEWHDEARFSWLYSESPLGPARVWVLEAPPELLVALSAAFPRQVIAPSGEWNAWVLGDFCIEKAHRSLGPAIALQRAACEAVDRGEVDLWYDFPSHTMLAIYARMGIRPAGQMLRMVHPLRVDSLVAKKVTSPALRKGVSLLGNAVLGAGDALRRRDRSIEVEPFDREFEGRFSSGLEGRLGVHLERTAEYLNWRYRRDPRGPASVLEAGGCFIAFQRHADQVSIVDAFGMVDDTMLRELALEVIDVARNESASSVVVSISDRHPWVQIFEQLGFQARDRVPFVVYARPGVLDEGTPWFLMSGDRDS